MKTFDHCGHNRRAWDQLAKQQNRFARPANESDFIHPLKTIDGPGWLGSSIAGQRVLCLGAGGGRHGPLYAAAGAQVTVVDISAKMLELDTAVAENRGLNLRTVETSMENLSMFGDASFEIVIHPVSTCYVPDISLVFREIARVTIHGGVYVSQHKQPTSLQSSLQPGPRGYVVEQEYGKSEPLPISIRENLVRESGTLEFIHSWQSLLGGICRSGFTIHDVVEPIHADPDAFSGTFGHRSRFLAPYIRIKAVRTGETAKKTDKVIRPELQ